MSYKSIKHIRSRKDEMMEENIRMGYISISHLMVAGSAMTIDDEAFDKYRKYTEGDCAYTYINLESTFSDPVLRLNILEMDNNMDKKLVSVDILPTTVPQIISFLSTFMEQYSKAQGIIDKDYYPS